MARSNRPPSTEIDEGIWAFDFGGSCFGIPIRVHYTLFLFAFIEVFAAGLSYKEEKFTLLIFILYGPVLTLTVLLHELGHAMMTKILGGDVDQIVLWPLGGYTLCSPTGGAVSDDLWIAVMGPAMHVPQAVIWLGVYAGIQKGDLSKISRTIDLDALKFGGAHAFASILAAQAIIMNACLFIFNLGIPAYPLDGGRCFAVFLVMLGFSPKVSAVLTSIAAILIGLTMVYYGTYLYVVEKSGSGVFIALVAMFICYSSLELCKVASSGRITDHPLFDRECYRDIGRQATQNNTNTERESTTTSLEAQNPKSSEKSEILC